MECVCSSRAPQSPQRYSYVGISRSPTRETPQTRTHTRGALRPEGSCPALRAVAGSLSALAAASVDTRLAWSVCRFSSHRPQSQQQHHCCNAHCYGCDLLQHLHDFSPLHSGQRRIRNGPSPVGSQRSPQSTHFGNPISSATLSAIALSRRFLVSSSISPIT